MASSSISRPSRPPKKSSKAQLVEMQPQVESLLERMRPAIQADGGDLEFVELTDRGVVKVRLHGACVDCPSSSMTLQMGIQRNLVQRVPGVTEVKQVD